LCPSLAPQVQLASSTSSSPRHPGSLQGWGLHS
jgi:hypothetical protein